MPKKVTAHKRPGNLKLQTRLTGFLQSSPPRNLSTHKTPSKRRRRIATPSSDESTQSKDGADGGDSDVGVIHFEEETVETGGEDESPRRPKRRRTTDRFDENEAEDDEEHVGIPVRWKGKGKIKVMVDTDDDSSPPHRKLIKGVRPPTPEDDDGSVDETRKLPTCDIRLL